MASPSSPSSSYSTTSTSSSVRVVEGPLGAAKATGSRPRVVDPLGSPEVEVVSSSSRIMTPLDTKTLKALMVMRSCHDCDSIITVQHLAEVRECYSVPREYELHVPLHGQRPYDTFSDGFGLSIDTLEAGLRELCEVDDRAGRDKYFMVQISDLPELEAEVPLKARWSNLPTLTRV
ncbi:hypothetical protein GW17_00032598 [Ensete ventricosum]|nr:hypothetical protein GW17_00032598 [Ensete ventricosum]